MAKIHDKISSDIYAFLQENKRVDMLTKFKVNLKTRKGIIYKYEVELLFSSIMVGEEFFKQLTDRCSDIVSKYTGNTLKFEFVQTLKDKHPVNKEVVNPLELSVGWEDYNSTKSIPKERFFNHFIVHMKVVRCI